MSVRIRLTRVGRKKIPLFRVVAAPKEKARDGRSLEVLGNFDPKNKGHKLTLNWDRYQYWLQKGAIPSRVVAQTVKKELPQRG